MIINDSNQFIIYLKTSEWLGSMSYFTLETTLADHIWERYRGQIRCFYPNPGVLISDNDYKTWQASLYMLLGKGKQLSGTNSRSRMKGAEAGNKKLHLTLVVK